MKTPKRFEEYNEEEIAKYRKAFIISTLRKASYRWPWRNIAATTARTRRGFYLCASCGFEVPNKDKKLDHIFPVVDPMRGFLGWDDYTLRLLCGLSGYQVLCGFCHEAKTTKENKERATTRRVKRGRSEE